jgi:adenylate kinase family enzyme
VKDSKPEEQRTDDKEDVLEKRITTFLSESMKAFDFYNKLGKVRIVDAMHDTDAVTLFSK